jgi:hypothetical protein
MARIAAQPQLRLAVPAQRPVVLRLAAPAVLAPPENWLSEGKPMAIARIEDGQIVEDRPIQITDVPEHKRGAWLPFEGEPPVVDLAYYTVSGPSYTIEPTRVLQTWTVTPRDLATVKAETKVRIDEAAETARLRYITAGAGQALEYQEAAEEAARYAATGGAGAYPMLQASVEAGEAPDLATAATLIGARENAWATIGANIRKLRLTAKRAVDAAISVDEVAAAATVAWP